jgi:hypothetical protein
LLKSFWCCKKDSENTSRCKESTLNKSYMSADLTFHSESDRLRFRLKIKHLLTAAFKFSRIGRSKSDEFERANNTSNSAASGMSALCMKTCVNVTCQLWLRRISSTIGRDWGVPPHPLETLINISKAGRELDSPMDDRLQECLDLP